MTSKIGLLRSSSEESFEHIDPDFDGSYFPELHAVALANYIPLEKEEILLKKGDKLVITEQSLDQQCFFVINMRSESEGKVPVEFVKVVTDEASMEDTGEMIHVRHSDLHQQHLKDSNEVESDLDHYERCGEEDGLRRRDKENERESNLDQRRRRHRGEKEHLDDGETESDLDQGATNRVIPAKRMGKMGIMRRKGVSKTKGSPYRSSGSSHDEDMYPLFTNSSKRADDHRRNELSHLATPPNSSPNHQHNSSSLISYSRSHSIPVVDPTKDHTHLCGDLVDFEPYSFAEKAKQTRSRSLAQVQVPEFKHIEKYNIVSVSGADRDGRPVIVFSACRLPHTYLINHQRLFEYLLYTLDQYVEQDYTVLYFHHGFTSANKPSITWLRHVYSELDRKYKKNLKKFYIVHPTNFIRMMMILLKPLISYKFGRKIAYINRLEELRPVLFLEQVDIPKEVKEYDARLMSSIRNVARTDSRSMFHIPNTAAYSYSTTDNTIPDSTRQFGVSLNKLKKDKSEDSLPLVIKKCTEYIENNGLEVTGIFRRAPNNAKIHAIKRRFDLGEDVDLLEYDDPHIPAVLIKMFLRELPEPLLTFEAYDRVVGIRGQTEAGMRLDACREVVNALPQANYDLLRYLITFLNKVKAHKEVNKMTAENLAIVFGPNLLWSTNEVASLVGLGEINSFTLMMINNSDSIFIK